MISNFIDAIQTFLIPLGWIGVFIAAIIEEVIAPIPSAFVTMGSGFLLMDELPVTAPNLLKLFLTISLPAAAGMAVGSLFVYGLAYWGGKPILERWGKWLGLSWQDLDRAEKKLRAHHADELMIFLVRTIPIIPSVAISAFCGLLRVKLKDYILFTFLGSLIRASLLGFIGWRLGNLYLNYAQKIDEWENVVLWGLAGLVIITIAYLHFSRRRGAAS